MLGCLFDVSVVECDWVVACDGMVLYRRYCWW